MPANVNPPAGAGTAAVTQGVAVPAAGGTRPAGLQLADQALNPLQGAQVNATLAVASASELFAGSAHTLDELLALQKNGDALPSFALSVTVRATTTTKVISAVEAPNVVGLLEGSDPKSKHEYVILGAPP